MVLLTIQYMHITSYLHTILMRLRAHKVLVLKKKRASRLEARPSGSRVPTYVTAHSSLQYIGTTNNIFYINDNDKYIVLIATVVVIFRSAM